MPFCLDSLVHTSVFLAANTVLTQTHTVVGHPMRKMSPGALMGPTDTERDLINQSTP